MRRQRANPPSGFLVRLKEIDAFFAGRCEIHRTMRRLVVRLKRAAIPHAIIGGMAVKAHGHRQTTGDVDVLLTPEGIARFRERLAKGNYDPSPRRKGRFIDRRNDTAVDVVLSGKSPGWLRPSPVLYPDPAAVSETIDRVCYANLPALMEMKLAAWRYQDLGDVEALIRVHNLDESFADRLHASVRRDYIECLEEKRRNDEYEAREG